MGGHYPTLTVSSRTFNNNNNNNNQNLLSLPLPLLPLLLCLSLLDYFLQSTLVTVTATVTTIFLVIFMTATTIHGMVKVVTVEVTVAKVTRKTATSAFLSSAPMGKFLFSEWNA